MISRAVAAAFDKAIEERRVAERVFAQHAAKVARAQQPVADAHRIAPKKSLSAAVPAVTPPSA